MPHLQDVSIEIKLLLNHEDEGRKLVRNVGNASVIKPYPANVENMVSS